MVRGFAWVIDTVTPSHIESTAKKVKFVSDKQGEGSVIGRDVLRGSVGNNAGLAYLGGSLLDTGSWNEIFWPSPIHIYVEPHQTR
jgi:hypothetical protein